MNKVARFITVVLAASFAIAVGFALTVFAHSGRTDGSGGHYDRSTGEYHYHHGYPAHDHIGGVCPYDYDDKTGESSGISSGSKPTTTRTYTSSTSNKSNINKDIIVAFVIFCFTLLPLVFCIASIIIDAVKYHMSRRKYMIMYGNIPLEELIQIPFGSEIGADGLPKEIGQDDWGALYTVYITKSGKSFHTKDCAHAKNAKKVHVLDVICDDMAPCKTCKPSEPELGWYFEYIDVKNIKDKYKIP